nr:MAG TPA: hypothetical protein [Caudoviricetes sp.]
MCFYFSTKLLIIKSLIKCTLRLVITGLLLT